MSKLVVDAERFELLLLRRNLKVILVSSFIVLRFSKPASEAHEDEGPFLPRPGGPAPSYYRYGAPAEYGRPGPVPDDYMP